MDSITRMNNTMLALYAKAGRTLALVGAPATAKTSVIRQMADTMGYELITLIGSRMDPTDVTGLPHSEKMQLENGEFVPATVYLANWWQIRILQKKKVVLFFDEFSNTPPGTRASLLSFLQDREFPNGQKLPEETVIVVAMNPTEESADGFDLDLPTINRMGWLSWKVSAESWFTGMLTGEFESDFDLNLIPEAERAANEKFWRDRMVRFLRENPGFIHQLPSDTEKNLSMYNLVTNDPSDMTVFRNAWPSRRSWDNVARVISRVPKLDVPIQDGVIQSLVGYSASTAFRDWIVKNDATISPAEVMKDPMKIKWDEMEPGDVHTILRACKDIITEKNYLKVPDLFRSFTQAGVEMLVAPFVQDFAKVAQACSRSANTVDKTKFTTDIADSIRPLIKKDKPATV